MTGLSVHGRFSDWSDCGTAKTFLAGRSGKTPTASGAPYLFLSDPVHQHLLLTGKTFFKGLGFFSLRRMALDIETDCAEGYEFSNPGREGDRIISVAVKDSTGYEEVLSGAALSEPEMLERLGEIIRARDPDALEGHNIFRFDLDYIRVRAARLGVRLGWGRDGSEPRFSQSRFTVLKRPSTIHVAYLWRSVVDTYFLVLSMTWRPGHGESRTEVRGPLFRLAGRSGYNLPGIPGQGLGRARTLARYNLDDVRRPLPCRLLTPLIPQPASFPIPFRAASSGERHTDQFSLSAGILRRGVAIPAAGGRAFRGGYPMCSFTEWSDRLSLATWPPSTPPFSFLPIEAAATLWTVLPLLSS